jgi:hypothetical protein
MSSVNFSEIEIYEGQTFDKLLKQIHENSNEKSTQISALIQKLTQFIKDPNDAALLVPLVAEYLEVGVKNDEQLIKLAGIVQRFVKAPSVSNDDSGVLITDAERAEIIANSKEQHNAKVIKMGVNV